MSGTRGQIASHREALDKIADFSVREKPIVVSGRAQVGGMDLLRRSWRCMSFVAVVDLERLVNVTLQRSFLKWHVM